MKPKFLNNRETDERAMLEHAAHNASMLTQPESGITYIRYAQLINLYSFKNHEGKYGTFYRNSESVIEIFASIASVRNKKIVLATEGEVQIISLYDKNKTIIPVTK